MSAFRGVRQVIPEARLTIIGPRDLKVDEPGVQCLGYLSKDDPEQKKVLADAFATARIFCLPTRFEPFGIVFLEAMYCGLPCVGTDAWAVPEMVEDGVTGYTTPVDDVATLQDRLLKLLQDTELAERMGAAGYQKATRDIHMGRGGLTDQRGHGVRRRGSPERLKSMHSRTSSPS